MIPYMSWWKKLVAWALWRWEGFDDTDSASFNVLEHPELLRVTGLLRDYWYIRHAKEASDDD